MKKFGLVGSQLGHSYSKTFFNLYFEEYGIKATYENFAVPTIEGLPTVLESGIDGCNVTIPYKQSIIPFLDMLSPEAEAIGAVNCVQIKDGKKIGHNTDAFGFQQSIKPFLTNRHERAAIFGTGGASKAVEYVLKQLGIEVIFVSRNPQGPNQFGYDQVNEHMLRACKLLVNTTPVGMYPNVDECLPIPFEYLTTEHLVVDLIYNPSVTTLLEKARSAGAQILNGETMLKQQALKSWDIWSSKN